MYESDFTTPNPFELKFQTLDQRNKPGNLHLCNKLSNKIHANTKLSPPVKKIDNAPYASTAYPWDIK